MENAIEKFNASQLPAAAPQSGGFMQVAQSREAQAVQAAMVIAQKFPRNENQAFSRIMESCKRKTLAERAVYSYPRGNQTVSGPSIRLAETIAKAWGNLDFGTMELERIEAKGSAPSESVMMAYCWDLETNVRQTKVFKVKHVRDTKKGSYKLEDERDVYEMTANQAARRLRSCILGVIPGDIVEEAVKACEKTLAGDTSAPLVDRIRSMAAAFTEYGVDIGMLEKRLGHRLEVTTEHELIQLRGIYTALRDNMASRDMYFDVAPTETGQAAELNSRLSAVAPPAAAAPAAPSTAPQPAQAPAQAAATAPAAAPAQEKPKAAKPKAVKTEAPKSEPAASDVAANAVTPPAQAPVQPAPAAAPQQAAAPAEPEPGSFDDYKEEPISQREPEYMFDFGVNVGKRLSELTDTDLAAYLTKLRAAPVKDDRILRAITAVEARLVKGEPA